MPASNRPWIDSSSAVALRKVASSDARPVMWARSVARAASTAVRISAHAVPRQAAMVVVPSPWASGMVTSITASEPTTATATGSEPSRIRRHHEGHDDQQAPRQAHQRAQPAPA
jgi:hypothetical protein